MKFIDFNRFTTLFLHALKSGATMSATSALWDISMGCSKPYLITVASHPPENGYMPSQVIVDGKTRWLDIETPCRKCQTCLENRRRLWRRRAVQEIVQSNRTWMGTLTISPHQRFMFSLQAGSRDYHASIGIIGKEMTKYYKRLRKADYKFRYLQVAEAHKDGYPHIHVLIHEVSSPIPKSRLQSELPHGFTNFKLVKDQSAAYYVAKYLAKDARTRIRASQQYGQSVRDLHAELLTTLGDRF